MASTISVILLAGGTGSRMKSHLPKQFLPLQGKPIALYSFEQFQALADINEIVVVVAPEHRHYFQKAAPHIKVTFALPGAKRQASVYNGLQAVESNAAFVCVHDAARPFITKPMIERTIEAARQYGAATVGMPLKATIKQKSNNQLVVDTPNREDYWEIQTPQIIRKQLFLQGFEKIQTENLDVTDDVSVVELLNEPVKLVEGAYTNIKITTPEDMLLASAILARHGQL